MLTDVAYNNREVDIIGMITGQRSSVLHFVHFLRPDTLPLCMHYIVSQSVSLPVSQLVSQSASQSVSLPAGSSTHPMRQSLYHYHRSASQHSTAYRSLSPSSQTFFFISSIKSKLNWEFNSVLYFLALYFLVSLVNSEKGCLFLSFERFVGTFKSSAIFI